MGITPSHFHHSKPCSGTLHPLALKIMSSGFSTNLLLEVPAILFVDEHEIEVVPDRELLVDVTHGRRQVVPVEEQSDGDVLSFEGTEVEACMNNLFTNNLW